MKDARELEVLQVTPKEAAVMLNYSVATIYNMMTRQELRYVGTRKMRRIPISELMAWQQRNII